MKSADKKAKEIIKSYIASNFNLIDVIPGACRYNYRCHNNSVHEALRRKHKQIVMCIYIDNGYPIIHFLNKDKKGSYYDNTLGEWCRYYDYYLIKTIKEREFVNVNNIFIDYRNSLRDRLPFLVKMLSTVDN
jgi:predicted aldo/keto reductase-like oxidoreductase